jgi:F-type H+-transporting ATPase subunit gamma
MANLKEIRTRLVSVRSTRQITSAMKMVSAAKLRKAQDTIIQMRPFANKLKEILANLTGTLNEGQDNVYGAQRDVRRALIVMISSNKGLCGAFNANVAKQTILLLDTSYAELLGSKSIEVLAVGKKAADIVLAKGYPVTESMHHLLDSLKYEAVEKLAQRIMNSFESGGYDEITLVYNQFRNAGVQSLINEAYLPIVPADSTETNEETKPETTNLDYILEPSREEIVMELIPKSLKIQLYKAFLDSIASEHGARMTAMHKATDNATDLIKELQLEYNKARQASITKEILEIVGGAEALKS